VFWGGHPKNDPLIGGSYMDVEQKVNGEWVTVLRDLDPATTYHWARDGVAYSKVTVTLDTAAVFPGTYRIRHRGHWKAFLTGAISSYEGVSDSFIVQ
ncbi:neutral/alkaline non-lysosomal ceramidase C-terminal domain-containing protein, partial [Sedimenticola sp.]|uniref:neutral/alkaline non-lysosomal ceramidase C-terminal domain-containing protein n=1 Tax=Sedimenticola sp. TaxID=1940285 RepID=UPI003D13CF5F